MPAPTATDPPPEAATWSAIALFNALPQPLNSVVPFVIVLGVLVFFHELGHYLAARWRGVHVEAFSIGFGRALATWRDKRGTDWKLAWIPLGGYVKLHGQEQPSDVGADVRATWLPGKTFHDKQVASRAIIVAAGPIANFILAAVLFAVLFATAGQPLILPEVGDVLADSAAAHAGLMTGDRIEAIDGAPIARFEDIQHIVAAHPAAELHLQIRRDGATRDVTLTTDTRTVGGHSIGSLGVTAHATEFHRLPVGDAVVQGVTHTWDIVAQTFIGLWGMISGSHGTDDLGGPLRIAQLSGEVAQLGVASLVDFIAVLSVNLGLINLFPIPVLDGGHLLFFLAEAVRGKPLPRRAVEYGFRAGFALLIGLFVFATWNDLSHLGLMRWVRGLIG
jgi:regulator of sigma E protease